MTRQRSFKRLVRSRMAKTGESYTAARAVLLAGEEPEGAEGPPLATSDEAIRERTGRGWEDWFDLLDLQGAADLAHRDIARWVASELEIDPLAWNAQAIAVSYERARGLRAVGERADGFAVTVSRTVAVPAARLFDAFADPRLRDDLLPGAALGERTATRPRSARFDWRDGESRVSVTFDAKTEAKSTVALEHSRLADGAEADRMRAFWRGRLDGLKARLEAGEPGA
jgi:hypothetical protein